VTLRGSDGILVLANRFILASRSSVFFGMLYGPFQEAYNTVVDVGYEGKVIQAIVQYIYTDMLPATTTTTTVQQEKGYADDYEEPEDHDCGSEDNDDEKESDDEDEIENDGENNADDENAIDVCDLELVRFLVALMDASKFFAVPALCRILEKSAKKLMLKNNKLVILSMAACTPDCNATKCLRDTALVLVKQNPSLVIDGTKSVVALIHPSYVEDMLKHKRFLMTEHSCFQVLQAWATAEVESPDGDNNLSITAATEHTNGWMNNRKRVASEMSSHIHLENISPTDLSTVVASSGLVL
jgi:hypothetical protein